MPDYILYDGRYSGQEIDAFLSRIERTAGSGPLQPELAGTVAQEIPYGQYVSVTKQVEADGSVTLIFGVPRAIDGKDGKDGKDGINGKSAYEYATDAGFSGSVRQFSEGLSELAQNLPISREAIAKADEAAESADRAAADAAEIRSKVEIAVQSAASALQSEQNASASEAASAANAASAQASAASAHDSAILSMSWAVGGTDTRSGEDTNNSKFWAEMAMAAFMRLTAKVMQDSGDGSYYNVSVVNAQIVMVGTTPDLFPGGQVVTIQPRMIDATTGKHYALDVRYGVICLLEEDASDTPEETTFYDYARNVSYAISAKDSKISLREVG